jgi:hypothetical protein
MFLFCPSDESMLYHVQGVVWECLDNVHGNTQYCKDDFTPYTGEEARAAPKVPADPDRGVLYRGPPSRPLTEAQTAARYLEQALALGMPQAPVDRDRELALQLQEVCVSCLSLSLSLSLSGPPGGHAWACVHVCADLCMSMCVCVCVCARARVDLCMSMCVCGGGGGGLGLA